MATYQFHVTLQGEGRTVAEAWDEAVSQFSIDPGLPEDETTECMDDDGEDDDMLAVEGDIA